MSFGFSGADFIAVYDLIAKVRTAYKDAPNNYRSIVEEVDSLRLIIANIENANLSAKNRQDCQVVLRGCCSVLRDLNSLKEKYNSLSSPNKRQVFKRVKLGTEDIASLRARLTSNTALLIAYIQRLDIPTPYCCVLYHILLTISLS